MYQIWFKGYKKDRCCYYVQNNGAGVTITWATMDEQEAREKLKELRQKHADARWEVHWISADVMPF